MYVDDIASKTTISDKEPTILSEKAASAYVDGENLLGPVVGNFSMQLAITKARKAGIGWVTAKGMDIINTFLHASYSYKCIICCSNNHQLHGLSG